MRWVRVTGVFGETLFVNLERFDIIHETTLEGTEEGPPCTGIVMVIDEAIVHEIFVKEKPLEIIFSMLPPDQGPK